MKHVYDSTGMTADLRRLREWTPPRELEIVRVRDRRALADWARVLVTVFAAPPGAEEAWLEGFGAIGFEGRWSHFVGYVDGTPVATTSMLLGGGMAGIYHVATMPSARGRGIGSAVTLAALQHARDQGATEGALQSSEMAVSVYRGLGFTDRGTLRLYDWKP